MFGLPDYIRACLFDLDGVYTSTPQVHAAARKELWGGLPRQYADRAGGLRTPFDVIDGHQGCVDGVSRVDGTVVAESPPGKPAPDTFLEAAERLGIAPHEAAVFEDAIVGVRAGRAGGFGYAGGIARATAAGGLIAHGADVAANDLDELLGR